MTAAHGGFGSEQVPLGGGAAVFERLCAAWQGQSGLTLLAAGAGPRAPLGTDYTVLAPPAREPSRLGVLEYARFCHRFQDASTELALSVRPDLVLAHDISEGPNVEELHRAGIPVATIHHVDVVDIFGRLYMGGLVPPAWLTAGYRRLRHLPWPPVLKLVFEKQEQVMSLGSLNIVPSPGAARLLQACYPQAASATEVIGWGAPRLDLDDSQIAARARELRQEANIPAEHQVVLTLSRLSPEKAQHRLLQAVALAEEEGRAPSNLTIVIAGAPAFMQGQSHARKLRKLASKLRTPVHFAGHVGGLDKAGWYRTADLFAVCSLHESYGLTTLEAMQQGCPVVAVSSYGTEATVSPEVGRLVPRGGELVRRLWGELELLLGDRGRAERDRLSSAARARAESLTFPAAASRMLEQLRLSVQVPG